MQYTARLSAVRTRESKRRGHYIAFHQIEGVWYRFDDAVVHSVVLQPSYNVNIVIYKQGDQPDYHSPVDLSNVPRLCRSVILNRSNKKSASQQPAQEVGQELQRPPPHNTWQEHPLYKCTGNCTYCRTSHMAAAKERTERLHSLLCWWQPKLRWEEHSGQNAFWFWLHADKAKRYLLFM